MRKGGRNREQRNNSREGGRTPATTIAATFDVQFAELADALSTGWGSDGSQVQLHATVTLALNFWTWRCLAQVGLDDETAAELMADAATCAAAPTRQGSR